MPYSANSVDKTVQLGEAVLATFLDWVEHTTKASALEQDGKVYVCRSVGIMLWQNCCCKDSTTAQSYPTIAGWWVQNQQHSQKPQ